MARLLKRIASAWRRHGPRQFVCLAIYNIAYRLRDAARDPEPDPFDASYGTETGGIREIGSLEIDSANARHAVRYQPSAAALVRRAIEGLGMDLSEFTFIDFGSGKGRVLMVAAGYPFRRVVGVEFSRELHETALRNISRLPSHLNRAGALSCICSDATEFELPESDLVCYFYNPFGPTVLGPLAERLAAHRTVRGRRVIVIYVDPQHREVFERTGGFETIRSEPPVLVLRA